MIICTQPATCVYIYIYYPDPTAIDTFITKGPVGNASALAYTLQFPGTGGSLLGWLHGALDHKYRTWENADMSIAAAPAAVAPTAASEVAVAVAVAEAAVAVAEAEAVAVAAVAAAAATMPSAYRYVLALELV